MPTLKSQIDKLSTDFQDNTASLQAQVADLDAKLERISIGGGEKARARHTARDKLLARERISPRDCILVEDTVAHLKGAKELGMHTAWVTQYLASDSIKGGATGTHATVANTQRPIYVDVKVKSVGQLFRKLHRLR